MKFSFKCHLVKIKNLYNNQNRIQLNEDISLMLVTPGRREDARSTCPAASSAPRPRPARCHAHPAPPGTWTRGTRSGRPSPPSWAGLVDDDRAVLWVTWWSVVSPHRRGCSGPWTPAPPARGSCSCPRPGPRLSWSSRLETPRTCTQPHPVGWILQSLWMNTFIYFH